MRRISGLIFAAGVALLIAWTILGANTLHQLLEDEGTESFSVRIGFGGLLGCIAFLMIVGVAGSLFLAYGVSVLRRSG